LVAFS
jgi:hypothetical protein